jgi:uncharacterized protein (UPF0248 family)
LADDRKVPAPSKRDKAVPADEGGMSLHKVLSQLEWAEGIALDRLQFVVVDRGAPDDRRLLEAPEVVGRDRSYLHLQGGGRIPYHRVLEIRTDDRVIWRRETKKGDGDPQ